jgi:putative membrane protein
MVHPAVWVCRNLKESNNKMRKSIILTLLCFGSIIAKAQIPQPDPDTTAKHFLIVASIANLQEASAGKLAMQLGKKPEVKAFGQRMVKDHGMSEKELLALAKRRSIDLPAVATGGIKPDLMLINAGANFDKLYVHNMVSGHNNTVQTFQNYATTGKDPEVKAWAQKMLPTLKMHLEHIKALEDQIK